MEDEDDASDKLFLGSSDTDDYISSDEELVQAEEDDPSDLLNFSKAPKPLTLFNNDKELLCNGGGDPREIFSTTNGEIQDGSLHEFGSFTNICDEEFDGHFSDLISYDNNNSHGELPDINYPLLVDVAKKHSQNGDEEDNSSETNIITSLVGNPAACSKGENSKLPSKEQYKCGLCGTQLSSKCGFRKHRCSQTAYTSTNNGESSDDMEDEAASPPKQRKLDVDLTSRLDQSYGCKLMNDIKDSPGEINDTCEVCDKTFIDKDQLQQHYTTHSDVKAFECNLCGQTLTGKNMFTRRTSAHRADSQYLCDFCDTTLTFPVDLQCHLETHGETRVHNCEHCDKTFVDRNDLITHIRNVHKGDTIFVNCEKSLNHNKSLANHIRTHTDEKQFSCHVCTRVFSSVKQVQSHISVHAAENRYKCPICGEDFQHRISMEDHVCIHQGTKRYTYGISKDLFHHSPELNTQMTIVRDSETRKCEFCDFICTTEISLHRHLCIHHHDMQNAASVNPAKSPCLNKCADENVSSSKTKDEEKKDMNTPSHSLGNSSEEKERNLISDGNDEESSPRGGHSGATVNVKMVKVDGEGNPTEFEVNVSRSEEDTRNGHNCEKKIKLEDQISLSGGRTSSVAKIKEKTSHSHDDHGFVPKDQFLPKYDSPHLDRQSYNGVPRRSNHAQPIITPLIPEDTSDLHHDLDQVVTLNTPEGAMYQCKVCGYQTRIIQSMVKHSGTHTGTKYSCRLCEALFTDQYRLQYHYCTSHDEEMFTPRESVPRHHTPDLGYRCEWCGKSYDKYQLYLDHCLTAHAQRKNYQCLRCNSKFSWRNSLQQHLKICMNTEIEIYKCDQCPSEFKRKRDLKVHIEGKHGETEKLHTCTCGKTYKWQSGLARHRNLCRSCYGHLSGRPAKCRRRPRSCFAYSS